MKKDIMSVFIEHMDSLYYEGYTQWLALTDPKAYYAELNNFKNTYKF